MPQGEQKYWLDDASLSVLQEMVQGYLLEKSTRAASRRERHHFGHPALVGEAPEIYVAKVPPGGIAGVSLGSMTGTGTGTEWSDDVFSSAECQVFQLIGGRPLAVPGLKKRVYNLGTAALSDGQYVPILRDKYGTWVTPTLGIEFTEC